MKLIASLLVLLLLGGCATTARPELGMLTCNDRQSLVCEEVLGSRVANPIRDCACRY